MDPRTPAPLPAIAWIIQRYGGHIFHWLRGYYRPALWTLPPSASAAGAVALYFYLRERRRHSTETAEQPQRVA